jgi:hypothetical protein
VLTTPGWRRINSSIPQKHPPAIVARSSPAAGGCVTFDIESPFFACDGFAASLGMQLINVATATAAIIKVLRKCDPPGVDNQIPGALIHC